MWSFTAVDFNPFARCCLLSAAEGQVPGDRQCRGAVAALQADHLQHEQGADREAIPLADDVADQPDDRVHYETGRGIRHSPWTNDVGISYCRVLSAVFLPTHSFSEIIDRFSGEFFAQRVNAHATNHTHSRPHSMLHVNSRLSRSSSTKASMLGSLPNTPSARASIVPPV